MYGVHSWSLIPGGGALDERCVEYVKRMRYAVRDGGGRGIFSCPATNFRKVLATVARRRPRCALDIISCALEVSRWALVVAWSHDRN